VAVAVAQHIVYGRSQTDVFFMEIVHAHVADAVITEGMPDASKLFAVGRLGGQQYTIVDTIVEIPRPGL
jgi:flavin reductase (DIM6/NTAB) family NADH-FMN oxidoreductase RutF